MHQANPKERLKILKQSVRAAWALQNSKPIVVSQTLCLRKHTQKARPNVVTQTHVTFYLFSYLFILLSVGQVS